MLLGATDSLAATLASATHPVTVVYERESDAALAQTALASAERAWTRLVDELGYAAPWTHDREDVLRRGMTFAIAKTGLGPKTAVAHRGLDVPATPQCDCSATLTIDWDTPNESAIVDELAFHELIHATQYASDCTAAPSAYEGVTVAAEAKEYGATEFVRGVVGQFQAFPEYPLDYWTMHMPCFSGEPCFPYQLGAALFPLYLVDRFEDGDARALPKFFASFAKKGTAVVQAPMPFCEGETNDWLAIVRRYVEAKGVRFDDALGELSVWRLVIGKDDDGAHFREGKGLPPVAIAARHAASAAAEGELDAYEHGSRYIELEGARAGARVTVRVSADRAATWRAHVVMMRKNAPAVVAPVELRDAMGRADVTMPEGLTRAVLVVTHIDDGEHLAEARDYASKRRFLYWIAPTVDDASDGGAEEASAAAEGAEDGGGCRAAPSTPSSGAPFAAVAAIAVAWMASRRRRT